MLKKSFFVFQAITNILLVDSKGWHGDRIVGLGVRLVPSGYHWVPVGTIGYQWVPLGTTGYHTRCLGEHLSLF